MSFKKPPLSDVEKERLAREFIDFTKEKRLVAIEKKLVPEKEKTSSFTFRIPISLRTELEEISAIEEISVTKVMIKLLRSAARKKLRMINESDGYLD